MAHLLFEIGRYSAFLGVFSFALFGVNLWMFRGALNRKGLGLEATDEPGEETTSLGAARLGETVHYLRRRDYLTGEAELQRIAQSYRAPIVWPFYLGVWSFCLGLLLVSTTFGFVLLP